MIRVELIVTWSEKPFFTENKTLEKWFLSHRIKPKYNIFIQFKLKKTRIY